MNYTTLRLAADSVVRAANFRVKLAAYMEINRPTLDGEIYDLLSEAYALTGNMQYNINNLVNEEKK